MLAQKRFARWTALVTAMAAAAVAVWAATHWRSLRVHYLSTRLERANTFTDARQLLETICRDSRHEEVCWTFVDKLGAGSPGVTFWFFTYLVWEPEDATDDERHLGPKHFAPLGPIVEGMASRIRKDDRLLAMWSQYLHWRRGAEVWQEFDHHASPPKGGLLGAALGGLLFPLIPQSIREGLEEAASGHPEQFRTFLYLFFLVRQGQAWLAGVQPLPELPELPRALDVGILEDPAPDNQKLALETWLKEHWRHLRFASELGRCVLIERDEAPDPRPFKDRGYPAPALPFRNWRRPVPAVPSLFDG